MSEKPEPKVVVQIPLEEYLYLCTLRDLFSDTLKKAVDAIEWSYREQLKHCRNLLGENNIR